MDHAPMVLMRPLQYLVDKTEVLTALELILKVSYSHSGYISKIEKSKSANIPPPISISSLSLLQS